MTPLLVSAPRRSPPRPPAAGARWALTRALGALCLLALATAALAAPVAVELAVPDRSEQARRDATTRGFERALLTLADGPLEEAQRSRLLPQAERYLQGYRYRQGADALVLQLYFDAESARRDAEQFDRLAAAQSEQGAAREPVLLWLGVTQGNLQGLLTSGARGQLPDTLQQVASALAQPLILPADSAASDGAVSVAQLRRGDVTAVMRASADYAAPAVLMASLALVDGDHWRAVWQLPGSGQRWRSGDGSLAQTLEDGLRSYARLHRLSHGAAVPQAVEPAARSATQVWVAVGGVDSMRALLRAEQLLAEQLGERHVRALQVEPQQVVFEVTDSGGRERVAAALAAAPALRALAGGFADDGAADLRYLLH